MPKINVPAWRVSYRPRKQFYSRFMPTRVKFSEGDPGSYDIAGRFARIFAMSPGAGNYYPEVMEFVRNLDDAILEYMERWGGSRRNAIRRVWRSYFERYERFRGVSDWYTFMDSLIEDIISPTSESADFLGV